MKSFSIGSKSFLFGEYGVLMKAPALLFCHKPEFKIFFKKTNKRDLKGFSPFFHSLVEKTKDLEDYEIHFKDSHHKGGFGRSSAEFLVFSLWKNSFKKTSLESIFQAYQSLFSQKIPPSGADLISQYLGGLILFNPEDFSYEKTLWPFKDISFLIYPTKEKTNTLNHLNEISLLEKSPIKDICFKLEESFKKKEEKFFSLINEFWDLLKEKKLIDLKVDSEVQKWKKDKRIKAVKGCGAKGSDSLVLFYLSCYEKQIKEEVRKISPYLMDQTDLMRGIGAKQMDSALSS